MKTGLLNLSALIALFFLFTIPALAQKKGDAKSSLTYVSPTAKLAKVYTKEDLDVLGKIELTKIYMERIAVVTELAPYLALHTKPGATLQDMGIPETADNKEHLEKEVKNKEVYLASVKTTLDDIIPYADKQNIVWAILFYQEMIERIDAAK
jgi:hypothetical protein